MKSLQGGMKTISTTILVAYMRGVAPCRKEVSEFCNIFPSKSINQNNIR